MVHRAWVKTFVKGQPAPQTLAAANKAAATANKARIAALRSGQNPKPKEPAK